MLKQISWKRETRALVLIMFLTVLLTAAITSAGGIKSKYIRVHRGGVITLDEGVKLVIPPRALEEDTKISAHMVRNTQKIMFKFKPKGIVFNKPLELWATLEAIKGAASLTLYYALDGGSEPIEEIEPVIGDEEATWYLNHFSLYYFRRR